LQILAKFLFFSLKDDFKYALKKRVITTPFLALDNKKFATTAIALLEIGIDNNIYALYKK